MENNKARLMVYGEILSALGLLGGFVGFFSFALQSMERKPGFLYLLMGIAGAVALAVGMGLRYLAQKAYRTEKKEEALPLE